LEIDETHSLAVNLDLDLSLPEVHSLERVDQTISIAEQRLYLVEL
jgi:hypothetical protein